MPSQDTVAAGSVPEPAGTPAPSSTPPAEGSTGEGFPVKNTFIHYGPPGTPLRSTKRDMTSPQTVPPDFAPEVALAQLRGLPTPGRASGATVPAPPTFPGTAGTVAPLRLFDFLPSPVAQAPSTTPAASLAPTPALPVGGAAPNIVCGGQAPMWQVVAPQVTAPAVGMPGQFMPPPPPLATPEGLQQAVQWSPWGGGPAPAVAAPNSCAAVPTTMPRVAAPAYPAGGPVQMSGCGVGAGFAAYGMMPQQ